MKDINILISAGIDVIPSIDSLGSKEIYDEILEDFYNENISRVKKIIESKKEKDLKNYTIQVHTIKSESLYLGMKTLSNICHEHQIRSKNNDLEYIDSHYDELMKELDKNLFAIKNYLKK